ncbi:MAG: hypothetical protein ACFFD4_04235 [Candidatus Odinarchaeota archaeon]
MPSSEKRKIVYYLGIVLTIGIFLVVFIRFFFPALRLFPLYVSLLRIVLVVILIFAVFYYTVKSVIASRHSYREDTEKRELLRNESLRNYRLPDYATTDQFRTAGFPDYPTYRRAREKGAINYAQYELIEKCGAPNYKTVNKIKTGRFPDYQTYKLASELGARTLDQLNFVKQKQAVSFATAVKTELIRISSFLDAKTAAMNGKSSKEEIIALKKKLEREKEQLTVILALLKDEQIGEMKEIQANCLELLTQIEERIENSTNLWLKENRELLTTVLRVIKNYGTSIEVGALHEKLSSNRLSIGELYDFLDQAEKEIGIWSFNGRYIELRRTDFPKSASKGLPICQICRKTIKAGDKLEWCPKCLNVFHYSHLAEWTKVKGSCPVCKTIIHLDA